MVSRLQTKGSRVFSNNPPHPSSKAQVRVPSPPCYRAQLVAIRFSLPRSNTCHPPVGVYLFLRGLPPPPLPFYPPFGPVFGPFNEHTSLFSPPRRRPTSPNVLLCPAVSSFPSGFPPFPKGKSAGRILPPSIPFQSSLTERRFPLHSPTANYLASLLSFLHFSGPEARQVHLAFLPPPPGAPPKKITLYPPPSIAHGLLLWSCYFSGLDFLTSLSP